MPITPPGVEEEALTCFQEKDGNVPVICKKIWMHKCELADHQNHDACDAEQLCNRNPWASFCSSPELRCCSIEPAEHAEAVFAVKRLEISLTNG